MATIISSKTSGVGGLTVTGDASGVLQLASANGTTAVTIDASQNVGIGGIGPVGYGGFTTLAINNATNGGLIDFSTAGTTQGQIFASASEMRITKTGANYITSYTNGVERMRIDSSGNVGIGTSSPSTYGKLVVSGGSTAIDPQITLESTAFNASQGCALNFARGGFTQPIQVRLRTVDNGVSASNFIIETKVDGTAGNLTERMRIDSSGNLLFNSGYGSVATAYGCRAWVNFNGTGTVAIRASGNVSSITDNGVGDYTVNFTTAMPDANYETICTASARDGTTDGNLGVCAPARNSGATYSTTAVRINSSVVSAANGGNLFDCGYVGVSIFR